MIRFFDGDSNYPSANGGQVYGRFAWHSLEMCISTILSLTISCYPSMHYYIAVTLKRLLYGTIHAGITVSYYACMYCCIYALQHCATPACLTKLCYLCMYYYFAPTRHLLLYFATPACITVSRYFGMHYSIVLSLHALLYRVYTTAKSLFMDLPAPRNH